MEDPTVKPSPSVDPRPDRLAAVKKFAGAALDERTLRQLRRKRSGRRFTSLQTDSLRAELIAGFLAGIEAENN